MARGGPRPVCLPENSAAACEPDARLGPAAAGAGGEYVSWRLARVPWALAAALAALPCADAATDHGRLSARETAVVTVLPNDRDALVALYHATGGPDWDRSDRWLTDQPIGLWHGVITNPAGRVERLELHDNDLRGPRSSRCLSEAPA